jgi:hypothetical protein
MEQILSWEAAKLQTIPHILWSPKVHYHGHKNLPLVPVISQISPVHTLPFGFFEICFNILSSVSGLPNGAFPQGYQNPVHIFFSDMHIHLSHSYQFCYSSNIWGRIQIMKLLLMQSPACCYILLGLDILISIPFPTLPESLSVNLRDQVLHLYRAWGKTLVFSIFTFFLV